MTKNLQFHILQYILDFSLRKLNISQKSRHSLETDEDISTDEEIENRPSRSASTATESTESVVVPDGRLINKLFHSTPSLTKKEYIRPRAETNDKLEKYKFMLINIEPDADILDPGTFGLDIDEEEDSYLSFEFNDYPSEVLYSSYTPHPIPTGNLAFLLLP